MLGVATGNLIDFSVNSNPFGPSPEVLNAIRNVDFSTYPDRHCHELRSELAARSQVDRDQILIGNGTSELIWLAARSFLLPGDSVVILGPTFGEYQRAALACGAVLEEIRAEAPDFVPPVEKLMELIKVRSPRLVFVCNPNNPTGKNLSDHEINEIVNACGERTILILDEAYRSFISGSFFHSIENTKCLILRSMTKDFAMAGLRLGYAVGDPRIIQKLADIQPAWSVNAFAQAAGLAAIYDLEYYQNTLAELRRLKETFFHQVSNAGYPFIPSAVQYGIIHVHQPARIFRRLLLRHGIQVRDCTSFGLEDYIRVSTKREEENARLVEGIRRIATLSKE